MGSNFLKLCSGVEEYQGAREIGSVVVASDDATVAELNTVEMSNSVADVYREQIAVDAVRDGVRELRSLATGLEALMVEVGMVADPDAPTEEELSVLRTTASMVRKEIMEPEQSAVIDDIIEGRLAGSQEGLTDIVKSVAKKINFTIGSWLDRRKAYSNKADDFANSIIKEMDLLEERISKLTTDEFECTMPAKVVKKLRVSTNSFKMDEIAKSYGASLDAWALGLYNIGLAAFKEWAAVVKPLLLAKDMATFETHAAKLSNLKYAIPKDARATGQVIRNKDGNVRVSVFESAITSPGMLVQTYYVPKGDTDNDPMVAALNAARAMQYYNADYDYTKEAEKPANDVKVKLTKAEIKAIIATCRDSVKLVHSAKTKMSLFDAPLKEWNVLSDLAEEALERDFVTSKARSIIISAHNSMGSPFNFALQNPWFALITIADFSKALRRVIVKSDLSK